MPILTDKYLVDTLKFGALAYYRIRDGSGTVMDDSSANNNNGTYSGSGINWTSTGTNTANIPKNSGIDTPLFNSYYVTVDYTQLAATTTLATQAYFDGAAGRATATLSSPAINTSAASKITLEMWVKWDGNLAGSNGTFEAIGNFGGGTGLLLGFLKNGASDYRFGLSVRNTGDLWGLSNATTLAVLPQGVYNHIVYVIVNNAVQTSKLYINGVQYTMTQQIGTSTTTDSVTSAFALAYDGTASFFGGSIGEVAIYNGEPFDATGVKNRYFLGAYGVEPGEPAVLPGVEAQIELPSVFYGPLLINNKNGRSRNLGNYFIREIGGLDDADVRFSEESNFSHEGSNPLTTLQGGRTVTLDGYIDAANIQSMRQMETKLKSVMPTIESPLTFRNVWNNGLDFFINVKKSAPLQIKESQTGYNARRDFLATFRSSYPYFESVGARTEVLQIGATVTIPTAGLNCNPVVKAWGPFSNMIFSITGQNIQLSGTVSASTFITIDARNRTVSDWTKWTFGDDFPIIRGNSLNDNFKSVAIFATATNGTAGVTRLEITWRHTL